MRLRLRQVRRLRLRHGVRLRGVRRALHQGAEEERELPRHLKCTPLNASPSPIAHHELVHHIQRSINYLLDVLSLREVLCISRAPAREFPASEKILLLSLAVATTLGFFGSYGASQGRRMCVCVISLYIFLDSCLKACCTSTSGSICFFSGRMALQNI